MAEQTKLDKLTHPEYTANIGQWLKYWHAYAGGRDFIMMYLKRYSKRETKRDFDNRLDVTYNPGDSKSAIEDVRDALLCHLHEVERAGDPRYLEMMKEDVDTFDSSMTTFIGEEVLPRLLTQSKVYVCVDAPKQVTMPVEGRPPTRADELPGMPYLWTFTAEQCKSWTYDDDGELFAVLIELLVDVVDPITGLTTGTERQFRYMRRLAPGESVPGTTIVGPGTLVEIYDHKGDFKSAMKLEIPRLPVAEFRISQSLMTDMADMQIALMNLCSTDMAFLFRGNFPLYTEQFDPATAIIKPRGEKRFTTGTDQNRDRVDTLDPLDDVDNGQGVGSQKGRRYTKGVERPGYVAPPTANLTASMDKQADISKRIRAACDLALTSLSVAAVQQSGESKKQDRVGLSAGLRYIATQLESGERTVCELVHLYLGANPEIGGVDYPDEYKDTSDEERAAELDRLVKARGAVRSATYQKEMSKQIIESQLEGEVDEQVLIAAKAEVDAAIPMDESVERAAMVKADVEALLVSKSTASTIRGYPPGETDAVSSEAAKAADQRAGFGTGSTGMIGMMLPEERELMRKRAAGKLEEPAKVEDEDETDDEETGEGAAAN
jgi:hypothetical protein